MSMVVMIGLLAVMWIFMIRAQKKQKQTKDEMMNSMKPGSNVVTIGGLHGVISEIDTVEDTVTIDCEGVYLTFDRAAIRTVKPEMTVNNDADVTTVVVEETPVIEEVEVIKESSKD